jgi:glycoprotein endo-alpha-1,2-mannosidase
VAVCVLALLGCAADPEPRLAAAPPWDFVHTFYYGWYANETEDGFTAHWNHDVLGVDYEAGYPGGDDIGANYYPALGTYSSNDPAVVETHVRQCADAGIGVIVVSWWGRNTFEDRAVPLLLDTAARHGVRVAFHLEPFAGRDAATSREAIEYLLDEYGSHPATYRPEEFRGRPMIYVYDSYLTGADEWHRLLHPAGDLTIRNTPYDVVAIGLWVNEDEGDFFLDGSFDGFYTYFGSDGFTYGSAARNWPVLAEWARRNNKLFIPCVGPGYVDTRIRPWNASTTRSREGGAYYDRMFEAAIASRPSVIGVTSFNEWHEGTQIEPAVPKTVGEYVYEDYSPLAPEQYLERTRFWAGEFATTRR